jgi:pseudouridine-5'-phosphate glycosidase/pseudouridine kinase
MANIPSQAPPNAQVVAFGAVAMDLSCDYAPHRETDSEYEMEMTVSTTGISPQLHTSNIATINPSLGGVGHNVALAVHRAGGNIPVRLCSFVADDL